MIINFKNSKEVDSHLYCIKERIGRRTLKKKKRQQGMKHPLLTIQHAIRKTMLKKLNSYYIMGPSFVHL
jgi:hypothetical protein